MTKLVDFSEKSVQAADAAITLGFDVVEICEVEVPGSNIRTRSVSVANPKRRCELDSKLFPELNPGDTFSLHYIVNHKDINDFYKNRNLDPAKSNSNAPRTVKIYIASVIHTDGTNSTGAVLACDPLEAEARVRKHINAPGAPDEKRAADIAVLQAQEVLQAFNITWFA